MELMHVHLQQMVYNKCLQFTHVRREVLKEVHMKMAVFCDFTMWVLYISSGFKAKHTAFIARIEETIITWRWKQNVIPNIDIPFLPAC